MRLFLTILAALTMLAAPASAQISILGLKNSLVNFALDQISTPGSFEMTAEGVSEPEDGVTQLNGLKIADADGVWFEAKSLSLRWNPSRILRGELEINSLVADGVRVLRKPAPSEIKVKEDAEIAQSTGGPFDWPRSPITVRVEELRIDSAYVAEDVIAPASIAFKATGNARDEGDVQALTLKLERTDDVAGRISLDYLRDFAADTLKLNLQANEAPGGLVPAIAGVPADSASRVTLDASGTRTDWRFDLDGSVEDVLAVTGNGSLSFAEPLSADVSLRAVPGARLDPNLRAALAPAADLDVKVAEDAEGFVRVERATLSSRDVSLVASGAYATGQGESDLKVTLDVGGGLSALVDGVEFSRVGFDGSVTGPQGDLTAAGLITLQGLKTAPADVGSARLNGRVGVRGAEISFAIDGSAQGVRVDRLGPDILGETKLTAEGVYDGDAARLSKFGIDGQLVAVTASGAADLAGETVSLDYTLDTPRLGPVAAAYDVAADGAMSARGHVEGPLAAPHLTGEVKAVALEYQGAAYGDVTFSHDLTFADAISGHLELSAPDTAYGAARIATDLRLKAQDLSLTDMTAQALGVTAAGAVDVSLDTMLSEGRVTLGAEDLGRLSRLAGGPVSGALDGRLVLSRADGRQAARFDGTLGDFAGFEAAARRLDVSLDASDLLGAPSATAKIEADDLAYREARLGRAVIDGSARDLTTSPSGSAEISVEAVSYPGVTVDAATARLEGADLTSAGSTVSATFRVEGVAAQGATVATVEGTASARDLTGALSAGFDVTAARIGLPGGSGSVASVSATGTVGDIASGDPDLDVSVKAAGASADGAEIRTATATAKGRLSQIELQAKLAGAIGETEISASAQAKGSALPPIALDVTRFTAAYGEEKVALRRPLKVREDADGAIGLEGLDLGLPGGGLSGDATIYPVGFAAKLALDMNDLGLVKRLAKAPIDKGGLTARLDIDTRPGLANGVLDARATQVRFDGVTDAAGDLTVDVSARWDGRVAATRATVSGPFERPFEARADLPVTAPGGVPALDPNGRLSGSVAWGGRIGDLWALVPAPGHILDGDLELALTLGGRVSAPSVTGDVSLTEGRYENLDTGTILVGLTARTTRDEAGRTQIEVSADDGSGGEVRANFTLSGESVKGKLTTNKAVLVRRDDIAAEMSADIAVEGPLLAPNVTGEIVIDRAEVRLVNATPPSVATLGDVRIKGEPVPPPETGDGVGPVLNLKIRADGDLFVRGRGLDSEWRLDLDVTGRATSPRITGGVEKVRGTLDLIGRTFVLERGDVRFGGGRKIDPLIDVSFVLENNDVTGYITIQGPVSDPEIHFSSRPELPEDEILPRVLFGSSKQGLNAAQAVQLATGVATLMSGTPGALDMARSALGVDVLRFDQDQEGNTSVTVGRDVAEGVFVGVEQPIDGKGSKVIVEVNLFDGVSANAEVGSEGEDTVGIKWSKDF